MSHDVVSGDGRVLVTILDWAKNPSELKEVLKTVVGARADLLRDAGKVPAVVTDVDDTLLRQSPYEDDDFLHEPLGAWLFDWCIATQGMKGHIITARPGAVESKKFLLQQLHIAGFRDPALPRDGNFGRIGEKPPDGFDLDKLVRVFMRPKGEHDISLTKHRQREMVEASGDTVLLTIGDQLGDHVHLEGEEAEICEARFCPFTYYVFCAGVPTKDSVICVKTPEKLGNWPGPHGDKPKHRNPDESTARHSI